MPNPINRITGNQWDSCARCGRLFPTGELRAQKGFKVCSRDYDNPEVEMREELIAEVIGNITTEGANIADEEQAFFLAGY